MKQLTIFILALGVTAGTTAQSLATQMAATLMQWLPDTGNAASPFTYELAVACKGLEGLWYNTGDARYYKYIQHQADRFIDKEGTPLSGPLFLTLYNVTGQEKYYKAAMAAWGQLRQQPLKSNIVLAQPFLAQYAILFHKDDVFDDIVKQFAAHAADFPVVHSPNPPSLGRGRYGMALVDVLDYFPATHPSRKTLLQILARYADSITEVEDPATVYTLAKAARKGYLPAAYRSAAEKDWPLIQLNFHDGGTGELLLAANELEIRPPIDKTVLLDEYYNNEHKKDITGATIRFHYIWNEMDNNGYGIWGHIFRMNGAYTDTLTVAPAAANLAKASVYIIVDPDNERESPAPNYPTDQDITAIENWVKAGGVLVLMANDSANCEFTHFNHLAAHFGVQFNFDDYHKVTGNQFEMGAFTMTGQDAIFRNTKKIYIKELSTLSLSGPAKPVFTDAGHNIMAVARVGKGTVFAVGDPWFYNEYTDGRKLPADFENYNAARDLALWLLAQAKTK